MSGNRVCVIGAGISGLVATKVLREDGFDVTTFDRQPTIGGLWSPGLAYPGLRTNSQREFFAFTDHPYPATADDYPSAEQVRAYLESYAERFKLRSSLRLSTDVVEVKRSSSPAGGDVHFAVTVRPPDGSKPPETLPFDFVVVCNGVFSIPKVAEFEGREHFAGEVLHSGELSGFDYPAGKRVVVVGASSSALNCATAAAGAGAVTTLVFRRAHWMMPRFFFGKIRTDHMMVNRFTGMFLPYHRLGRTETFLHEGFGRWMVRLWWLQSEALIKWMAGVPKVLKPDGPMPLGFANLGVGGECYALVKQGKVTAKRAGITRFTDTGLELDSGEKVEADLVILATGWHQDAPFLSPDLHDLVFSDGHIRLYRFVLPPREPRLGFIGYNVSIACQFTSEVAAHWLSQCFRGELVLPSVEAMEDEIMRVARWAEETFPGHDEGYLIGPHVAYYADELLEDMGLSTRRKNNIFAENFSTFWPERYSGLTEERKSARTESAAARAN